MMFVSFEGVDGVGKTTQVKLLVDRLRSIGRSVYHCYEPGTTELGKEVRQLLEKYENHSSLFARTRFFLIMAARNELGHDIEKAFRNGEIVVSDRYIDSTVAYQSVNSALPFRTIQAWNDFISGTPDVTFLLTMSSETFNNGGIEPFELSYLTSVENNYRVLAEENPERFVVIEGGDTIQRTHDMIWDELLGRFRQLRRDMYDGVRDSVGRRQ